MITVYLFDHGWFWMIPLPNEVMSVGVVGTRAFFKAKGSNIDALFAEAVAATPSLAAHMANAEPLGPLAAGADYSYDLIPILTWGRTTFWSAMRPLSSIRCFRAA